MKIVRFYFGAGRIGCKRGAFSLVEVALALGIAGFALVGIVGSIPLAMNNSRLSIAQSRAASLASTVFANFRSQPFGAAQYVDDGATGDALNLNAMMTKKPDPAAGDVEAPVKFYAAFDEVTPEATTTPTSDRRRLHFSRTMPAGSPAYQIVLRFSTYTFAPDGTKMPLPGMLLPYATTSNAALLHAQANAVEASITELDRPNDVFRFNSVIANRTE